MSCCLPIPRLLIICTQLNALLLAAGLQAMILLNQFSLSLSLVQEWVAWCQSHRSRQMWKSCGCLRACNDWMPFFISCTVVVVFYSEAGGSLQTQQAEQWLHLFKEGWMPVIAGLSWLLRWVAICILMLFGLVLTDWCALQRVPQPCVDMVGSCWLLSPHDISNMAGRSKTIDWATWLPDARDGDW